MMEAALQKGIFGWHHYTECIGDTIDNENQTVAVWIQDGMTVKQI